MLILICWNPSIIDHFHWNLPVRASAAVGIYTYGIQWNLIDSVVGLIKLFKNKNF